MDLNKWFKVLIGSFVLFVLFMIVVFVLSLFRVSSNPSSFGFSFNMYEQLSLFLVFAVTILYLFSILTSHILIYKSDDSFIYLKATKILSVISHIIFISPLLFLSLSLGIVFVGGGEGSMTSSAVFLIIIPALFFTLISILFICFFDKAWGTGKKLTFIFYNTIWDIISSIIIFIFVGLTTYPIRS